MGNSPYRTEIPIDTPMICITEYIEDKVKRYGLSIRFYAGDDSEDHKVFSSGSFKDNKGVFKSISFNDFVAVIKYKDFDIDEFNYNPSFYLLNYKVQDYGK